jgi:hypothetical protein
LIREKVYAVGTLLRRGFSWSELLEKMDIYFPGTNHSSIQPSDYLCRDALKSDASNLGNRGNYGTFPRFIERLGRNSYVFLG